MLKSCLVPAACVFFSFLYDTERNYCALFSDQRGAATTSINNGNGNGLRRVEVLRWVVALPIAPTNDMLSRLPAVPSSYAATRIRIFRAPLPWVTPSSSSSYHKGGLSNVNAVHSVPKHLARSQPATPTDGHQPEQSSVVQRSLCEIHTPRTKTETERFSGERLFVAH